MPHIVRCRPVLLFCLFLACLILPAAAQDDFDNTKFLEHLAKSRKAFERIGQQFADGEGQDALPELLKFLEDDFVNNRRQAALRVAELGPSAVAALPALSKLSEAPDPPARYEVFRALGAIGLPALPALIKATKHEKPYMRSLALETIGSRKLDSPAARAAVRERLNDENLFIRANAAEAAGRLNDATVVDRLVGAVQEDLRQDRPSEGFTVFGQSAAVGLIEMNHPRGAPLGRELFAGLIRDLLGKAKTDELEYGPGYDACDTLARLGTRAAYGLPVVIEGLADPHWRARLECVLIARRLGTSVRGTTTGVVKALDDVHPLVRFHAAIAVGYLGDDRTLPAIERRLKDEPDWAVRFNLLRSLKRMATEPSLAVYKRHDEAHGLDETSAPDWGDYRGKYPGLFSKERLQLTWASKGLANMAEPPLSRLSDGYAFRMLIADAGFTSPNVVRVFTHNGQPRVLWRSFSIHSADADIENRGTGYTRLPVDRPLNAAQWEKFKAQAEAYGLHRRPTREKNIFVLGGLVWILEEFKDGKYHAIIRYSPEERDEPLAILRKLLEDLAAEWPGDQGQ